MFKGYLSLVAPSHPVTHPLWINQVESKIIVGMDMYLDTEQGLWAQPGSTQGKAQRFSVYTMKRYIARMQDLTYAI